MKVDVSTIPRKKFRERRKPNGRGTFLTVDFVAEIEVLDKLTVTLKYDNTVANVHRIDL